VVLAGKACAGVGLPWITIAVLTLFQRRSPLHLQGRVFTALEVLVTTPQTVSIGVGAALVAALDYRWVLGAEAAVLLLSAAILAAVPGGRGPAAGSAPESAADSAAAGSAALVEAGGGAPARR
jgi:hypothetical protein